MQIFVLGAGYVGRCFLRSAKHEYTFYASTTSKENVPILEELADHVQVLSSNDRAQLQRSIDNCDALLVLVAPRNAASYADTYLETARSIAETLKTRQKPLYLLYTSSTQVYQGLGLDGQDVLEDTHLKPFTESAQILAKSEELYLGCASSLITPCILRLGGIYGPERDLTARARRLAGQELPGTGNEPTNHIHVEDIARAMHFCIAHQLQGVFNLVNDAHPTRKALYETLCTQLGLKSPTWNPALPDQRGSHSRVSAQKIEKCGFAFKHPHLIEK